MCENLKPHGSSQIWAGTVEQKNKARKANDLLIARLAVLDSTINTNDFRLSDKNSVARLYVGDTCNEARFYRFFDYLMKQARGY